jgi:outer membrane immunogenic protein
MHFGLGGAKMKRLLLTTAAFLSAATIAFAADVPVKAPPAAPVAFNWTGCYVGAVGGETWGKSSHVARSGAAAGAPITGDFNLSGGIAGGSVGCNLEVSNFVFGVEDDYSWTNIKGNAFDRPPFTTTAISATRGTSLEELRGRFGYAWDRFMIYGTAGLATARIGVDVSNPAFGTVSDTQPRAGWTAGGGGEWAAVDRPMGGSDLQA